MGDSTTAQGSPPIRQLSAPELKALLDSGTAIELVDVRTKGERAIATIDGSRLLDEAYHDALLLRDRDTPIVFQCHLGIRSQNAAEYFRREGFRNLYNLQGGIDAWSLLVERPCPLLSARTDPSAVTAVDDIPLLIDFATPSSIFREHDRVSTLPIVGNGPPGTFVLFPNGFRVSLPTDQIVFTDDSSGHARVGFGGMQFVGSKEGQLVFVRIREMLPEDQLSPDRSHTMRLDSRRVAMVSIEGRTVWPS